MGVERTAFFVVIAFLIGVFGFVGVVVAGDNESIKFEFDLIGPPEEVISISVPPYIYFGNISAGEYVRTAMGDIKINNTGNVDVRVTANLTSSSDPIFDYLYLSTYADNYYSDVEDFEVNVSSSSSKNIYAKINLTDYNEDVPFGVIRKTGYVMFTATKK